MYDICDFLIIEPLYLTVVTIFQLLIIVITSCNCSFISHNCNFLSHTMYKSIKFILNFYNYLFYFLLWGDNRLPYNGLCTPLFFFFFLAVINLKIETVHSHALSKKKKKNAVMMYLFFYTLWKKKTSLTNKM